MQTIFKIIILFILPSLLLSSSRYTIDKKHLTSIEKEYGLQAKKRVISLIELLNKEQSKTERQKLKAVNDFFNAINFESDLKIWHKEDYWASRTEFLGKADGDCEDYVIAKYFTLMQLGIPTKKLYLTYVKAIKYRQSHMVLSYYPTDEKVPLILDNINKNILPATQRTDLRPIFNFNVEKIYLAKQRGLGKVVPGSQMHLDKWTQLILKIKKEGE